MKQPAKAPISLASIAGSYGTFLRHRNYRIYLAIVAVSYGGLFAWISGSSFVLQDLYDSRAAIRALFAAATLGYGAGTLLAARLVVRLGIDWTIVCGAALAAGGIAMLAAAAVGATSPRPGAAHGALSLRPRACHAASHGRRATPFPERAGAASSLLGFLQQTVGSSSASWSGRRSAEARCRSPRSSLPWACWRWRSRWSNARWARS